MRASESGALGLVDPEEPLSVMEYSADTRRIMAEFSGIPGVEALADAAYQRMLQAFESCTRTFPLEVPSSETPEGRQPESSPTTDLRGLVTRGARNAREVQAFGALVLLGMQRCWPGPDADGVPLASALLWTECESRLPILTFLVQTIDVSRQSQLAVPMRNHALHTPGLSRGLQSLALLWAQTLSGDAVCLRAVLGSRDDAVTQSGAPTANPRCLQGRVLATPRGPFLTALAAFSGWMLLRQLVSVLVRFALAYRAQAELSLTEQGIVLREQTTLLGRKVRDRTQVIALNAVRSLSREVRYARAGTYAGLMALAVGSFLGMRLFVDGVRAPGFSGPTMFLGLVVVIVGLVLDFALANWLDSSRTRCRLLIRTAQGRGLYLTCDEPVQVEGVLRDLARRLSS